MNLLWLSALEGTLLLLLAWTITALWRNGSAAWRHVVWTAAIGGLLVLPILLQYAPNWFHAGSFSAGRVLLSPVRIVVRADGKPEWSVWQLLIVLWSIGAALLLLRWLAALLFVQRVTATARPATDAMLAGCCAEAGILQPVELRYTTRLTTPVVWGLRTPVLLLPEIMSHADDAQRRSVFLHELAHVQRRDWAELCLTQVTAALYWFHPLVWLAVRQVRRERERACDDRVVTWTAAPERYAEQLLEVARATRDEQFSAAVAMVTKSELEERIMAILDNSRQRARVRWYGPVVAGLVTLGLLVPLAAIAQEKGDSNKEQQAKRPSKIRVGGNVMQAKIVRKVTPVYPTEAKRAGIQGAVLLRVTIGEDGAVQDLDVMSGPPELVQSASDAVRQWLYQPTLLNGQPITVETTVEVNYTLAP